MKGYDYVCRMKLLGHVGARLWHASHLWTAAAGFTAAGALVSTSEAACEDNKAEVVVAKAGNLSESSLPATQERPKAAPLTKPLAVNAKGDLRKTNPDLFTVYTQGGRQTDVASIVDAMSSKQVVFLGEYHDDAIAHSLELELLQQAHARYASQAAEQSPAAEGALEGQRQGKVAAPQQTRRSVSLSLEMLERDVQSVVDEYLAGHVWERDLAHDGRLWPNYWHDYRPLLETAKAHNMPVVCANPPRRYVSLAGRSGREALEMLPVPARQWLPPLPWALPSEAYVHKTNSLAQMARDAVQEDEAGAKGENGTSLQQGAPQIERDAAEAPWAGSGLSQPGTGAAANTVEEPGNNKNGKGNLPTCPWIGLQRDSNYLAAQTLWDAGMAWSLAEHLTAQRKLGRDPLVCHVSGKFHCEHLLGIPEHLKQYAPDAEPLVVIFMPAYGSLTLTPEQFAHEQLANYAHFVVLTDGEHPRSFNVQHPV